MAYQRTEDTAPLGRQHATLPAVEGSLACGSDERYTPALPIISWDAG